jgi:hypothetical protein
VRFAAWRIRLPNGVETGGTIERCVVLLNARA